MANLKVIEWNKALVYYRVFLFTVQVNKLQISLALSSDFSPYENCLKTIVYTLLADLLYGKNI
jgi:hypothetical protein